MPLPEPYREEGQKNYVAGLMAAKIRGSVADDHYDCFMKYWILKETGAKTSEVAKALANAKVSKYAYDKRHEMFVRKETFRNYDFHWGSIRSGDEDYNSYDCETSVARFPWKFSESDEKELREEYWIRFVDPYCDGVDCTGASFTSYMKFLKYEGDIEVIHRVDLDV